MVEDENAMGRRLRDLRETAGRTQAEVAQMLTDEGIAGIHPQTIVKLEAGQRALKWREAEALSRVLDFELSELAEGRTAADEAGTQLRRFSSRVIHKARAVERAVLELADEREFLRRCIELDKRREPDARPSDSNLENAELTLKTTALHRWLAASPTLRNSGVNLGDGLPMFIDDGWDPDRHRSGAESTDG